MFRFLQFTAQSTILATTLAISLVAAATSASFAQTSKHKSPAEMAAADRAKAEKTAACRAQAKAQKLTLLKRRAFVKTCVAG